VVGFILEDAAEAGDWGVTRALMRAGADARINSFEPADKGGQVDLAAYFLDRGVPLHTEVEYAHPLLAAVQNDDPGMIELTQRGS